METANGKSFVLESQVFWDDGERRNLRVLVDVWDPLKRVSLKSVAGAVSSGHRTDRSSASSRLGETSPNTRRAALAWPE